MATLPLSELDVDGRRVFVRADLDVALTPARGVADPARVDAALPTLRHLLERGARVVVGAHVGAPKARATPELSLEPVAAYLAEALGREVYLTDEPVGDGAKKVVSDLREGEIALLENLRFDPGEEANDEAFARGLAAYADVYVNDALAASGRPAASTVALPKLIARRGMGLLLERERKHLTSLSPVPGTPAPFERPFVAVVGGARASDKLRLLDSLLGRVNAIYLGGGVANTFLRARGGSMGRSMLEDDKLFSVKAFLRKAEERDVQVILPRDVVAAAGVRAEAGKVVPANNVPEDLAALDIGPETIRTYGEALSRARTVFWNGPMGVAECEPFAAGTVAIAKALSGGLVGTSVAAGGDTATAIRRAGVAERFTHVSLGGTAALELFEGHKLPGLIALET